MRPLATSLLAALLAGCAGPLGDRSSVPEPEGAPAEVSGEGALHPACSRERPHRGAVATPEFAVPSAEVPRWEPGDRWTYHGHHANAGDLGTRSYRVLGFATVLGADVYCVNMTRARAGVGPQHERLYFALEDLNSLYPPCDRGWNTTPCAVRYPILDFPLWDGKAWSYECCGDAVVRDNAIVRALDVQVPDTPASPGGGERRIFRVTTATEGCERCTRNERDYAPWAMVVLEERIYSSDGALATRWTLTEHDLANAQPPDRR